MKLAVLIAVVLLSSIYTQILVAEASEYHDIIVIGAGMAGLAAADELNEKYSVLVLEARDRIGGRIWTDDSLGMPIDLGASWIHGIDDNPIWALAQQYELDTVKTDEESEKIHPEEFSDFRDNYDPFKDFLSEHAKENPDASLQDAVDAFIDSPSLDLNDEEKIEFRSSVYQEIELDFAADAPDLSVNYKTGYRINGQDENDVVFPAGYNQTIEKMAEGLEIKLGHIVQEVDYTDKTTIQVITNQGSFTAKYVISTVPLGILKNNEITFSPELSSEKMAAINNLQMGLMNKNYFLFDKVFWDNDVDWITHVTEDPNEWPLFFNFAKYIDKPLIMGFSTGQFAHELEELSDDEIKNSAIAALREIYGENVVPEPTNYLITRWASDPFAKGTYAYIPVGGNIEDYAVLRDSVDNRIFFAGEATDIYPQTVHGAYLSGKREAVKIMLTDLKEDGKFMTPLEQESKGMYPYYVECNDGLELIIRPDPTRAACVTSDTAMNLIDRELAQSPENYFESILFLGK